MADEPKLNPSTGISNFARPDDNLGNTLLNMAEERQDMLNDREKMLIRRERKVLGVSSPTPKQKPQMKYGAGLYKAITYPKSLLGVKAGKLKTSIVKARLRNQIQIIKMRNQLAKLKQQNQIKQIVMQPIRTPRPQIYPAYSTPSERAELDSAFNADINHADGNIFGGENYFDEDFYTEDYYGNEWNLSPWEHLSIKPQAGVNPLFW